MSTPTNELQHVGALRKEREGRRTYYRAIESAPLWTAMRVLEGASRDPGPLLEAGLVDVPGLQAALIFGSAATGEQREAIDLDVLIVEEPTADHRKLLRHLAEAALLLSREVDAVRYTPQALADRLGDPTHPAWGFVRQVLSGPKRWIAGAASVIAPLAAAAGLSTEDSRVPPVAHLLPLRGCVACDVEITDYR